MSSSYTSSATLAMEEALKEDQGDKCCVCGGSRDDADQGLTQKVFLISSKCGHTYCDTDTGRLFQSRREIKCVLCDAMIKRSNLVSKTREQLLFEREMSVRKKVMKEYNRTEDDFENAATYNEYLEEMENIIYDLVYGTEEEKEAAQRKRKKNREENAAQIAANDARKAEEERRMLAMLAEEQRLTEERKRRNRLADMKYETAKQKAKAELQEVALGERDADSVTVPILPTVKLGSGPLVGEDQTALNHLNANPGGGGGIVLQHPPPQPVPGGRKSSRFAESRKLRKTQQAAGGFDPSIHFQRNLQEAQALLFRFSTENLVSG